MDNMVNIRLELGIDARRFIQQVQVNNQIIEDQVSKGIELALNDILKDNSFVEHIRSSTKDELLNIVNRSVMTWEIKSKITKLIEQKVGEKIEEYADRIAEEVTKSLK